MKFKKPYFWFSVLLSVLILSACGKTNDSEKDAFTGYILNPHPGETYRIPDAEDAVVTVRTEYEEYKVSDDTIGIIVECIHPNTGFWFFCYPGLEKKVDGEWKALPMTSAVQQAAMDESAWFYLTKEKWESEDACLSHVIELEKRHMYRRGTPANTAPFSILTMACITRNL